MFYKHTLKYLLGIFLLSFSFIISSFILFNFISQFCLGQLIKIVTFFLIVNIAFHLFLIYFTSKSQSKFFQIFMLLNIVKILIYMTFLIIYLITLKFGLKCYLISFLIVYIGFTLYEVIMLSRFFKNKTSK